MSDIQFKIPNRREVIDAETLNKPFESLEQISSGSLDNFNIENASVGRIHMKNSGPIEPGIFGTNAPATVVIDEDLWTTIASDSVNWQLLENDVLRIHSCPLITTVDYDSVAGDDYYKKTTAVMYVRIMIDLDGTPTLISPIMGTGLIVGQNGLNGGALSQQLSAWFERLAMSSIYIHRGAPATVTGIRLEGYAQPYDDGIASEAWTTTTFERPVISFYRASF